jgi:hypothetical protein
MTKMLKGRRVGTFTAGIVLIGFGVLFLLRTFLPVIDYHLIFTLWPVILILLGLEIIISGIVNRNDIMKYDAGAILIVLLLALFAMCMAGVQFAFEHASWHLYW